MSIDPILVNKLCKLTRLQTSYKDQQGRIVNVKKQTLIGVLEALLGRSIEADQDVVQILSELQVAGAVLPRVVIAWNGVLKVPLDGNHGDYEKLIKKIKSDFFGITPENETVVYTRCDLSYEKGLTYLVSELPLPLGYHTIFDETMGIDLFIIAAPWKCPAPPQKSFAIFASPYSLVDQRLFPRGDLSAIETFGRLSAEYGAGLIALLPMFAEASRGDGAPPGQSPYSPLSRSFLNEAYLDIERIPEIDNINIEKYLQKIPSEAVNSYQREIHADLATRADEIEPLLLSGAKTLISANTDTLIKQKAAFIEFCRTKHNLDRYAQFRAIMRQYGTDIGKWPSRFQNGDFDPKDLDQDIILTHKYAQFATDRQLRQIGTSLKSHGVGFLFDLPIGCSKDSFDVWAYRDHFAQTATIGAPPDDFFQGGQNWGLPPVLPNHDRLNRYLFFRNTLRSSLVYADVLRIDHILGFSRLWWVPNGNPATEGAYVSYPSEELIAMACLEASRSSTHLLGEDLGTVETDFRRQLNTHGISQMRVSVFEFQDRFSNSVSIVAGEPIKDENEPGEVAFVQQPTDKNHSGETEIPGTKTLSANLYPIYNNQDSRIPSNPKEKTDLDETAFLYIDTHDTATFAGWLESADIDIRFKLCPAQDGTQDQIFAQRQMLVEDMKEYFGKYLSGSNTLNLPHHIRDTLFNAGPDDNPICTDKESLLAAVLLDAATGPVNYLVVSLEDLIGEIKPQNIPGTGRMEGNFCRLLAMPLDNIFQDKKVRSLLELVRSGREFAGLQPANYPDKSTKEKS